MRRILKPKALITCRTTHPARGNARGLHPAVVAFAAAACSPGGDAQALRAEKDRPLVIGLDELLSHTGGSAAVAVGNPRHGRIERRGDGALVYTPQAGYTGDDTIIVTTTDAVRLYTT